jgi:hypothetical protein
VKQKGGSKSFFFSFYPRAICLHRNVGNSLTQQSHRDGTDFDAGDGFSYAFYAGQYDYDD